MTSESFEGRTLASLEEWAKNALNMSYEDWSRHYREDLRKRLLAAYKRTPRAAGFDHARTVGAQLEDNPYEAKSPDHVQWTAGYATGFKVSGRPGS